MDTTRYDFLTTNLNNLHILLMVCHAGDIDPLKAKDYPKIAKVVDQICKTSHDPAVIAALAALAKLNNCESYNAHLRAARTAVAATEEAKGREKLAEKLVNGEEAAIKVRKAQTPTIPA